MGWFSGEKKRRVLIIDDEVSLRTMIGMFFQEMGFEVLEASSGDHGIQIAEEKSPDIILLDIMMPGMSGVDTLRYLRELPQTRKTPIIMVTAKRMVEDVERCLEAGANDFVQKPFQMPDLLSKIERILSENQKD